MTEQNAEKPNTIRSILNRLAENRHMQAAHNLAKDHRKEIIVSAIGSVVGTAFLMAVAGKDENTIDVGFEIPKTDDKCPREAGVRQGINSIYRAEGMTSGSGILKFEMADGDTVYCAVTHGDMAGAREVVPSPELVETLENLEALTQPPAQTEQVPKPN